MIADWARRVADFFRWAETRPVLSGSSYAADAALAAIVTIAAVVAAGEGYLAVGRHRQVPGAGSSGKPPNRALHDLLGPTAQHAPLAHLVQMPSWALLGVVLATAPLAFRRTYPTSAFCVILAAVIATSHFSTAITVGSAIFAAYCAVVYSRYRRMALLSLIAGAIVITLAYPQAAPQVPERFTALLILLPTVAAANMMRVWRQRADDSADRLRRAQSEHEADTRRAIGLERARIASELHDVVTHNVSVMVVQAGAARRVLDSSPGDADEAQLAREALLAIEASGRTAMTELRYLLGLLAPSGEEGASVPADGPYDAAQGAGPGAGDASGPSGAGSPAVPVGAGSPVGAVGAGSPVGAVGAGSPVGAVGAGSLVGAVGAGSLVGAGDATLSPQPGVAQIPALLARVCATGLPVELSVAAPAGARRALSPGIDLTAYRVVQEALTNVIKHSGQAHTVVQIEYRPRELLITISDDGQPADTPVSDLARGQRSGPAGRGLVGLRERVAIYGGELDAGPRPGGGWRVSARIPLEPMADGDARGAEEDLLIWADFQAAST